MHDRYNLFKESHKAIRSLLLDLVRKSGRTDFNDRDSLDMFRAEVRGAFALLESHACHEETFIASLIQAHAPELAGLIGGSHQDQERQSRHIIESLGAIDARSVDAAPRGHSIVVWLSRFAGEILYHMADEEERLLPLLWRALTDEELIEVERRLVASVPPDETASFLSWMLPAVNTPERVAKLRNIRASSPPEVFSFVRDLSRTVLSPADEAALSLGLAETKPQEPLALAS